MRMHRGTAVEDVSATAAAAQLDIRKARIVASLYPTRVRRGMTTDDQARGLAVRLGVSPGTLRRWETGDCLPSDGQVPTIEAWLAEGPVWRYAGINRIVGPEKWHSSACGVSNHALTAARAKIAV